MKTKQHAIQDVYIKLLGEKMYNENKSVINFNNGTIKLKVGLKLPNNGVGFRFIATFSDYSIVIANDLIGIENNNGWIKIESEDDLPKEIDGLWEVLMNGKQVFIELLKDNRECLYKDFKKDGITHYKIVPKSKPPIFQL